MSDVSFLQSFVDLERRVERLETIEKPAVALPYNPATALQPYAANNTIGYFLQYAPIQLHRFRCGVFVVTTNNGANYWTVALYELKTTTIVAQFSTQASAANTYLLFDISPSQPASDNVMFRLDIGKTGAPGNLTLVPSLYALFQT
jgi:hypothetical protein